MALRGRPKKEVTRNHVRRFRTSDEEEKMIEYLVRNTGMSMSDIVRESIVKRYKTMKWYEQ